jgi:hypothetical protein
LTRYERTKFIDARICEPSLVYVYTEDLRDLALQGKEIPPKNYRILMMQTTATTKINHDEGLLQQSIHSGIESDSPINVRKTAKLRFRIKLQMVIVHKACGPSSCSFGSTTLADSPFDDSMQCRVRFVRTTLKSHID